MKTCNIFTVLNLIITGIPSIPETVRTTFEEMLEVLNLIITGIPSILRTNLLERELISVLNLIITGIPSIL